MNIFQEIKERLSLKKIVRAYGIELNRSDMCKCPFHAEKTASMKVYDKGFRCYGCGESVDTIKFVEKLFNLSNTLEVAHKINEDFRLGIQTNNKPTRAEVRSAQSAVKMRMEVEQKDRQAHLVFSEYFKILCDYSKLVPKTEYEIPDKRFIEYIQNFEQLDYTMNRQIELMHGTINERMEFLNDNQTYLSKIAERLLEIRQENKLEQEQITAPIHNTDKLQTPVTKENKPTTDYKIIGNTLYRNIENKAYLKYNNSFAENIANELQRKGIRFSGKVTDKMTTFTIDNRDLRLVRDIASCEAEKFTSRNKPLIIPSQKQINANVNRQSERNEMAL